MNLVDLFTSHELALHILWVVDLVAWELSLRLPAHASFIDHLLTAHALSIMALLDALVTPTRKELLTKLVTSRYWFNAALPLTTKETFNSLVAARAINLPHRVFLAWLAFSWVADLLTSVVLAV